MHIPLSSLAFGLPNGYEWVVILIVASLIFGRRLLSVMRMSAAACVNLRPLWWYVGGRLADANKKEADNSAPGSVSRDKTSATESNEDDANYDKGDEHQRSL